MIKKEKKWKIYKAIKIVQVIKENIMYESFLWEPRGSDAVIHLFTFSVNIDSKYTLTKKKYLSWVLIFFMVQNKVFLKLRKQDKENNFNIQINIF